MAGWITPKKKKDEAIGTFPIGEELVGFESLTPSQTKLNEALLTALTNLISQPVPAFDPSTVGGFSPYGGAVGSALEGALLSALSGEVPTAAFETGVAAPTRRTFEEETAPAIREEFAGPGTYWGTARAGKVTGRRERMELGLVEQRARMVEGALQRALQATGPALTAQQTAIQLAFEDFIRRNPAMAETMQSILSYLNIPMLATYQPYDEDGGTSNPLLAALGEGGWVT